MILQACETLPSCLASSSRPALARMIFCSLVICGCPPLWLEGTACKISPDFFNIGLAARFEHPPQPGVGAIQRVGQHPRAGRSGVQGGSDQVASGLRLGGERDRFRHLHAATPCRIAGPDLGEIKLPVNQRLAERARIGEEDANLTVLDPSGRARILPGDADRVRALFQETGLVHDQHAAWIAQACDHLAAYYIPESIR